jgi:alpha-glucosidase
LFVNGRRSATTSLDSDVLAVVSLDANGTPALSVERDGDTVLAPSPIGVVTAEADLTTGLRLAGRARERTVADRYRMTTGKTRSRESLMREARFELVNAQGAVLGLRVPAADDGVAYRYELPAGADGGVTVTREASSYQLPTAAPAWLQPYGGEYENFHTATTAGAAPTAGSGFGYPALFDLGSGTFALITESDISGRYSGTRLHHAGAGRYQVGLDGGNPVQHAGDLATPWRVVIVGGLDTLVESTLVDDLAPHRDRVRLRAHR